MLCLAHRCTLLGNIVTMLASCSPQPSLIPTYKRAWRLFHQFLHAVFQTVSPILPVSPNTIALFIAYMFGKQYAPSTVSSYVSALSFAHKFLGFHDPTKAFFVTQILKGYHKQGSRLDSRLPITLPILHKLLDSACKLAICRYQVCQFKAMCYTAFYAFLRVGEMTSASSVVSPSPIQIGQLIKLTDDHGDTVALKLVFANYKHSYNQRPFSIVIDRHPRFCPVQLLLDYLALRSNQLGPLVANMDNPSLSTIFFEDILRLALTSCGLNPSRSKGHSFRIRATSFAADRGMCDAQIRALGRWKSSAFLKYIRLPSLSST